MGGRLGGLVLTFGPKPEQKYDANKLLKIRETLLHYKFLFVNIDEEG